MNIDEQDELWRLLGKASKPRVSPFFARNVLREIRLEKQEPAGLLPLLFRRWKMATVIAAAVALGSFITIQSLETEPMDELAIEQISSEPDFDVIVDLDELLAYEENTTWIEDSIY
jgi:hypothetical protein